MAADKTKLIRLIQVAIRDLGLREEEYRTIYTETTRKDSLKAMNIKELWQVAEAMKGYGFKISSGIPGDAPLYNSEQAKLVRHHWLTLHRYREVRNPAEAAMLDYVKRITGISRMEWLKPPQMTLVVETMKRWRERVEDRLVADAVSQGYLPPKPTTMAELELNAGWYTARDDYLDSYNTSHTDSAGRTACANRHG